MYIKNQIIDRLTHVQISKFESCRISNSIISTIDFDDYEFEIIIEIENCIIGEFLMHSCWYAQGLRLIGNYIEKDINYIMGGHNKGAILFDKNIFNGFFNFFDCHFENELRMTNNIFLRGSNLLGNKQEGFHNLFEVEPFIENNIGNIKMDKI